MKHWAYIIGILIIISLISVWVFLLFADDETKQDVYNTFGFQGNEESGFLENIPLDLFPDEETIYKQLRQLTTRRTIGHTEVATASSTRVLFVEAGTGHVYAINPKDGQEERVSNITIPVAREAVISASGTYVAILSETNKVENVTIIDLSEETPTSYKVKERVLDFKIVTGELLTYSTTDTFTLSAKSLNLATETTRLLFEVPFKEARVVWGTTETAGHIIYPKTSRFMEGYVYEPLSGGINRLPAFGYGLSAIFDGTHLLYQKQSPEGLQSYLWTRETGVTEELFFSFFPEKCTVASIDSKLYCGYSDQERDMEFPDNWYRGEKKFADELWETNLETKESKQLISPFESSGRELDITQIEKGQQALYFINKNDQTLWVYDLISNPSE